MTLFDLPPRPPENIPNAEIQRFRFAGGLLYAGFSDYELSEIMSRQEYELNSLEVRQSEIVNFISRRGIEN